ncbi:Beta-galactoside-specific lectin 3 [Euphorbia peplus]|nr:Beta-galactoside-specific lectin 3 [Euphorbia peplus]
MEGKTMLWIVMITCFWCSSVSHQTFQSFLRNPAEAAIKTQVTYGVSTKISGPSGQCLQVINRKFKGPSIALNNCRYNSSGLFWKFETDGTIQTIESKALCLTADVNYTQGSYLYIEECNLSPRNTTIWDLADDGVITNPTSGLVLTAKPGPYGPPPVLTLETNIFSSYQTWRVGNDTNPSLVSIIGMNTLCLQVLDNVVWVEECASSNLGQRWLLYSDGTIRPQQNTETCISYDSVSSNIISVMYCGLHPSSERWFFTQSGTILNKRDNVVMDVARSKPSLKRIIVYAAHGGANQRWEILPLPN